MSSTGRCPLETVLDLRGIAEGALPDLHRAGLPTLVTGGIGTRAGFPAWTRGVRRAKLVKRSSRPLSLMAQALPLRAVGLLMGFSLATAAGPARASDTKDRAKGVAGGMLLGSEVVCMTGGAFGLEPAWAYGVGAAAGAALGGWAGYNLAGSTSARPSSFLLAGGIALVIPALISVITATQLQAPETLRQEEPTDTPPPEGRLDLPTLEVLPVFTRTELAEFGMTQATEVRLSLLRGVF